MFKNLLVPCVLRRFYATLKVPLVRSNKNSFLLKLIEERGRKDILATLNVVNDEIRDLLTMKETSEKDFKQLIDEEIEVANNKLKSIENDLIENLVAFDDSEVKEAIVEVSAGVGGQEAMLFAGEMLNLYLNYIQFRSWELEITDYVQSELGGVKKGTINVRGDLCYQALRHEAGIHRVQRVPATEKSGRMHTSTVTVAVLPLRERNLNIDIPKNDLEIDAVRSTGAGGQHVNKTNSCIRIKHIPTGIVVECQEERHQVQNKERAMRKLKTILARRSAEKAQTEESNMRKSQILNAARSDKIRTYNFQQDRITDHRLSDNINNVVSFMEENPQKLHQLLNCLEENYRKNLYQSLTNTE